MRALTVTEQSRMLAEMPVVNRAVLRELRIEWDEASIVFTQPRVVHKDGTVTAEMTLSPQTVRIRYETRAFIEQGSAGLAPVMYATLFGVRDHPTEPDTDMEEGYTFIYTDDRFRITDVYPIPGGIVGIAQAIG